MKYLMMFGALVLWSASAVANVEMLEEAVAGKHRTPAYVARDAYRNPVKTLSFFGVEPDHTVMEVWPSGGWYTEILAPYLKKKGKLIAAHYDEDDTQAGYRPTSRQNFDKKVADNKKVYGKIDVGSLWVDEATQKIVKSAAESNSVDRVVTFRSAHGWFFRGTTQAMLDHFYDVLKPGGKLGIVQHMADQDLDWMSKNLGYVGREYIISVALKAGFVLEAEAYFNRNPKDHQRYGEGVWQLPPTLRGSKTDAAKAPYLDIGESNRMTLLFVKPQP